MKKILFVILLFTIINNSINAQNHNQWVVTYNGYGFNDAANSIAVDKSGNVVAAGNTELTFIHSEGFIIKYNPNGQKLWDVKVTDPNAGYNFLSDVCVDDTGNIYVTGVLTNFDLNWDIFTAKYDSNGVEKWRYIHNGTSNSYDGGTTISLDKYGNCVVGGYADNINNGQDYIVFKFDPSGTTLWRQSFNGAGFGNDVILSMTIDDSSNVFVTGRSVGIEGLDDFATIKYDVNGNLIWYTIYNDSTVDYGETPRSIKCDKFGNVFVSGWGANGIDMGDMLTIKYNNIGEQQWLKRFHGNEIGGEGAYSVRIDDSGNSYVGGSVRSILGIDDYAIVKYDPDGNELWSTIYDGPANGSDWILSMELGKDGNIYATGWSEGLNSELDIVTIAFDTSGSQKWIETYDGKMHRNDEAFKLILDEDGIIYSTGFAIMDSSITSDLVIIKYSSEPTSINNSGSEIPNDYLLSQNYPNPFNPNTKINFVVAQNSLVTLKVYDILGKEITTLVNENKSAGNYEVSFNASALPSGVYFYKLQAGSFSETKKMVLMK